MTPEHRKALNEFYEELLWVVVLQVDEIMAKELI